MQESFGEIQEKIFSLVAEETSKELPLNITLTSALEDATLKDIQSLKEQNLIIWDFSMKAQPCMTPVSNPEHMIKCVAYYGDAVNGYYCAGYALGSISVDNTTIEINFIEKRKDASTDLCSKFLPIIVDAFTTYGLYLNSEGVTEISKFALVGPVPGVKKYYQEQGFELVPDYSYGMEAMIKYMDK